MPLHTCSSQRSCLRIQEKWWWKDCLVLSLSTQKRSNCTKQNLGQLHTQSGTVSHKWYHTQQTCKDHPQLGSLLSHQSSGKNRSIFCTNDMNWMKVRLLSLSRSSLTTTCLRDDTHWRAEIIIINLWGMLKVQRTCRKHLIPQSPCLHWSFFLTKINHCSYCTKHYYLLLCKTFQALLQTRGGKKGAKKAQLLRWIKAWNTIIPKLSCWIR